MAKPARTISPVAGTSPEAAEPGGSEDWAGPEDAPVPDGAGVGVGVELVVLAAFSY